MTEIGDSLKSHKARNGQEELTEIMMKALQEKEAAGKEEEEEMKMKDAKEKAEKKEEFSPALVSPKSGLPLIVVCGATGLQGGALVDALVRDLMSLFAFVLSPFIFCLSPSGE